MILSAPENELVYSDMALMSKQTNYLNIKWLANDVSHVPATRQRVNLIKRNLH